MNSPASPVEFDIDVFETADIADFVSMITPRNIMIINREWLQSCFELVYGTRKVSFGKFDGKILTYCPQSGLTLDDAMQIVGTPDILTWGMWMTLTQYLDEHACSVSAAVPSESDLTPWSAVEAPVA